MKISLLLTLTSYISTSVTIYLFKRAEKRRLQLRNREQAMWRRHMQHATETAARREFLVTLDKCGCNCYIK